MTNDIHGITITIAVSDLDAAVDRYRSAFGLPEPRRDVSEADGVAVAMFEFGASQLHLIAGTSDDSMIAKEVAEKGEGIHHAGFVVGSVDDTLASLSAQGVRTLGDTGRPGAYGNTVAFVHPKSTHGVLVELVQPPAGEA
ncbi:MAG TPA: VOC family protein [Gaiellaceae bacterium]|jgi:methylmalonyl-CoA epimerase|nr:VOC family protein [Gaiellaceae bacterium]